jgi:hypothetical protein
VWGYQSHNRIIFFSKKTKRFVEKCINFWKIIHLAEEHNATCSSVWDNWNIFYDSFFFLHSNWFSNPQIWCIKWRAQGTVPAPWYTSSTQEQVFATEVHDALHSNIHIYLYTQSMHAYPTSGSAVTSATSTISHLRYPVGDTIAVLCNRKLA